MPRTKAECARAVIETLRPAFENTANIILALNYRLDEHHPEEIEQAIQRLVDGGLAKNGITTDLTEYESKRLESAGLSTAELIGHGFAGRKIYGDRSRDFFMSKIVAASCEDKVQQAEPAPTNT